MEGLVIMEILKGMDFEIKNSAVSLGKFDGIHLGTTLHIPSYLPSRANVCSGADS